MDGDVSALLEIPVELLTGDETQPGLESHDGDVSASFIVPASALTDFIEPLLAVLDPLVAQAILADATTMIAALAPTARVIVELALGVDAKITARIDADQVALAQPDHLRADVDAQEPTADPDTLASDQTDAEVTE